MYSRGPHSVCLFVLPECALNCLRCTTNGAGLCDVCNTNYLLDSTYYNCSRQLHIRDPFAFV